MGILTRIKMSDRSANIVLNGSPCDASSLQQSDLRCSGDMIAYCSSGKWYLAPCAPGYRCIEQSFNAVSWPRCIPNCSQSTVAITRTLRSQFTMRTTRSIILKTTTTTNSHATRTKISRLNATATTTPTSSLPTPIPSTPQITIISTIEWSADGFTGFRLDLAPQFFRQNQFKGWTIKVNGMDGSQLMYMEQSSNAINTYQTYINPPFQYRQTDSDVLEWWFQKQPLTFNRTHPLIWRFVLRSAINQAIAVWPERVLDVSGWLQDKSEWYSTSIAGFNSTIIRRKSRWFNQTSHSVASMMSAASSEAGSVYLFRNHAGITVSAAECDTVLFTGIVAVIIGLSMSIVQLARLKIS